MNIPPNILLEPSHHIWGGSGLDMKFNGRLQCGFETNDIRLAIGAGAGLRWVVC